MHLGTVVMVGGVVALCHDGGLHSQTGGVVVLVPLGDGLDNCNDDNRCDQQKHNAENDGKNIKHKGMGTKIHNYLPLNLNTLLKV